MGADGQGRDVVARCLAALAVYHEAGETDRASAVLSAAAREIAIECLSAGLTLGDFRARVLDPVREALNARHDWETGNHLYRRFLNAFMAGAGAGALPGEPG
jgi:hypothetical protein